VAAGWMVIGTKVIIFHLLPGVSFVLMFPCKLLNLGCGSNAALTESPTEGKSFQNF
jgi:hypothetical protein